MRKLTIDNPVLSEYLTDISTDYSSGISLYVRNNNSFQANDLIVVGNPGEEQAEQKKIDNISGNNILTLASSLKFAHNKTTNVYKSLWDFISIEGRSSSSGSWSVISSSPIQWDSSKNKTTYFHSDGGDSWEYRFRFNNSITGTYSEYSPTLSGAGFSKYQMGYIITRARRVAGDIEGRILTTDELLRSATSAKNTIRAKNSRLWFWKVDGYQSNKFISATAGNNVYSLDSIDDLGVVNYIEYRYTSNGVDQKYILRKKDDAEFLSLTGDLTRSNDDRISIFRLLPPDENSEKGYFEVDKKIANNNVGIFYISYYKEEADYNSVDDRTYITMPEILEDYLIADIYAAKGNEAMAKKYSEKFSGPDNRKKTLALSELTGIALLIELDKQYQQTQNNPRSLFKFRGQNAVNRLYGNRSIQNMDQNRENYFSDE